MTTRKTITITDEQEEWIQNNYLNLSGFVQDRLDDLIEERSKSTRDEVEDALRTHINGDPITEVGEIHDITIENKLIATASVSVRYTGGDEEKYDVKSSRNEYEIKKIDGDWIVVKESEGVEKSA